MTTSPLNIDHSQGDISYYRGYIIVQSLQGDRFHIYASDDSYLHSSMTKDEAHKVIDDWHNAR